MDDGICNRVFFLFWLLFLEISYDSCFLYVFICGVGVDYFG